MNFYKKLKHLGFKKINPSILVRYDYPSRNMGWYIEKINNVDFSKQESKPKFHEKIQTHMLMISDTIQMYIVIHGYKYTVFINRGNVNDINHGSGFVQKNNIDILIDCEFIDINFWKVILNTLKTDEKRQILLKQIC